MRREKYIRLTKKEIENRFDEYNQLYFNGQVVKPSRFETYTPSKKILGLTRPLFNKKTKQYTSALHISKRYRWTEANLRHVIVHEMIHLYIEDYLQPLRWWEKLFPFLLKQHNHRFINEMDRLNQEYNLDIKTRFPEMHEYLIY